MKVGINLYLLQPRGGGMTRYVMTLLRHWHQYAPDIEWVLFTFAENALLLEELLPVLPCQQVSLSSQDEITCHLDGLDLYFCPFIALYPRPVEIPSVITMPDIQGRFFPEYFPPDDLQNRIHHIDESLHMTEHIIAISKFTATSLNRVLRISRGRIHTIPLCADTILLPEQPDLPRDWAGPFAFYPANDLPHKNHRGLFDALQRLQDTGVDIPLILTGDRRMELLDVKSITDEYGLQAHVLDLGHVSCAQLSWLYKNAKMLVFPSRFEGFGLPVLEAMQHELPVTCSGTTSLPEVGGEAALYFDPNRPEDMAEKIGRLWLDHVLRDNLRNAGRLQAAQFTAERMVKAHRDVFISAVHSRTKKRWHPFSIAWEPRRAGPLQRQYRRAQHLLRDSRTGK